MPKSMLDNKKNSENNIKPIAYYLPQYHPVPENDLWWGKGFTEWTNVAKAKPLFKGHKQPKFPADLGYYDLRVPEIREAQAAMAKQYGLYGFCYYHYWFGNGKQLLERPFNEVLVSKKPDFPFMLCWANQTWTGHWFGADKKTLIEQQYPGDEDVELHFNYLIKAFEDERYIKIDGKPVFKILDVLNIASIKPTVEKLRALAHKAGLKGLYLVAGNIAPADFDPVENGFDAGTDHSFGRTLSDTLNEHRGFFKKLVHNRFTSESLNKYYYDRAFIITMKQFMENYRIPATGFENIPVVLTNWDNTPRSLKKGIVIKDCKPEYFAEQLNIAAKYIQQNNTTDLLFVKSWNEWAEGNYLEPDTEFGFGFLEQLSLFMRKNEK